ncbi:MAG TPA: LysE family transporter [Chitinophagales bacterium]|nr:LysE family transporter [Chitinophagales bacterium]HQO90077.1 LysE family transporter [Chitinophagales bacterium]
MDAIIKGLISGTTVSLLIGPIFIALVDITITKGWRSGLAYVFGIIFIDTLLIYALYELLGDIDFMAYQKEISLVGGIVLVLFGILTFTSSASIQHTNVENIKTYFAAFLKGITINILNPFVIVWWMGIYTTVATFNYSPPEIFAYYFSLLLMVFLFDLLKIRFAYYIKNRLKTSFLTNLKKVAGVCLFIFGVAMLVRITQL